MKNVIQVTITQDFTPSVMFDHVPLRQGETHEQTAEKVLKAWQDITGLAWTKMPREQGAYRDRYFVEVPSPLGNRGPSVFSWAI
jgi:hypothetical protein